MRTCQAAQLTKETLETTIIRTDDLEMLLTPKQWISGESQAKVIGKRFAFLRQQRNLSTADVAHRIGANEHVIVDIELTNLHRKAVFNDYMQYADVLEYSLREIFDVDAPQARPIPLNEDQLLVLVETAMQQRIAQTVGLASQSLRAYPRVETLLMQVITDHRQSPSRSYAVSAQERLTNLQERRETLSV